MSSETIVNGLFLITAVIAAAVLINAIMPAIYRTSETFGSSTHQADSLMRTDFKFVNGYAKEYNVQVWLKNTGTARIAKGDLDSSDIFILPEDGIMEQVSLNSAHYTIPGQFPVTNFWNQGETLNVNVTLSKSLNPGDAISCSLVLPNGMRRSFDFTAS
ncbi:MAG: flagellin [Methanoregulaceae archaeon]|jgi:flagellar protein FlaG